MAAKKDHYHVIRIEVLVDSLKEKLEKLQVRSKEKMGYTIKKVNPDIRMRPDAIAYDPKYISIGPLHRDKQTLKVNEDLKFKCLKDLLNRSPQNTVDKYVEATRLKVSDAIRCYPELEFDEQSQPKLEDFVMMLVIDGCFLIELFIKHGLKDAGTHHTCSGTVDPNLASLRRDSLLLENQIPFFILETLFKISVIPNLKSDISLAEIALYYLRKGKECKIMKLPEGTVIYHLLHLYHISIDPARAPDQKPNTSSNFGKVGHFASAFLYYVLHLHVPRSWLAASGEEESSWLPRVIPPATNLEETGIRFKKREEDGFFQVVFENGELMIPYLPVSEVTVSLFRNLVAFEDHFPESGTHFTRFAVWLQNIVDTSGDVVILAKRGIVENEIGKNHDAADFLNSLCKGVRLDYGKHYPVEQFKRVLEFTKSDRHRWHARFMRDYFSSPWSIISLMAACLLLVLTVLQTIFTVLPYYIQPSTSSNG